MTQFKGIKQVTKAFYNAMADADKSGYLFLVRDGQYNDDGKLTNVSSEEIYFGGRKYGDTSHRFVANVIESFGGLLDPEGGFILPIGKDFISFDDSKANNLSDVLYALDGAIKANADKFASYYTKSEVDALISPLQTAIKACLTGVSVKVGDATYAGEVVDGVATVNLTDAFESAGKVKDVTVDGESVMDGTTAKIDLSGKANVSDITALDGRLDILEAIKHAADVVYDPETKYINLKDSEGKVLGTGFDATPFIVDGMLSGVDFVKDSEGNATSTLRFTFNADGEDKTIDVDFAKYVDVYKADGTSIELDSTSNTFSVKEVDASKTKLSTSIEVKGGPLADDADDNWPWKEGDKKVIPSGKTMEEILTALFLKVVNGTVEWKSSSLTWSPTLAKPTVSLSTTSNQEVGASVTVSSLSTNSTVINNVRQHTCTASEGYFLSVEGAHNTGDYTIEVDGDEDGTPVLSCKWNNNTITTPTVNETTFTLVEGTNTLYVKQTGVTASCEAFDETTVYASTNTKVIVKSEDESGNTVYTTAVLKDTKPNDIPLSSENSASVKAYYKYYIGFATTLPANTSDIKKLTSYTNWLSSGNNTYTIPSSGQITCPSANYMVIAIPSTYKVTEIVNGFGTPAISEYTTTTVDYTLANNTTVEYTLYYKMHAAETKYNSIKFKKK